MSTCYFANIMVLENTKKTFISFHFFLEGTRGACVGSDVKTGSHLEFPQSLPPPGTGHQLIGGHAWEDSVVMKGCSL